jgi:serine/threonine-protein kinase RsbW
MFMKSKTKTIADVGIKIAMTSSPAMLPVVRAAVEKLCEQLGFDSQQAHHAVLAVDEALSNIIRHGYAGDQTKPIDIELLPVGAIGQAEGLMIRLRDYGRAFEPSEIPPNQACEISKAAPADNVSAGGYGVHIMKKCMDKVEYKQADGGGMELTLVKFLPKSGKGLLNGR